MASKRTRINIEPTKSSTVFCISHVKGGCGKTVTAVQIAAHLASQGRTVILGDFDLRGGSVSNFIERREAQTDALGKERVPPFTTVKISSEEHLKSQIMECRANGWDMVNDTHPKQANSLAYALTYCDINISPVRQGHTEMESWGALVELLDIMQGVRNQYRLLPLESRSLITDFRPTKRGRLMRDQMFFQEELHYLGEVPHSEKFGDAILEGLTLWEYLPNHPHSRQIREIINECTRR